MIRSLVRIVPVFVIILSSLLVVVPAHANVDLSYFRVVPGSSPTQVAVQWATETETDTAAFIIRRGLTPNEQQATDIQTVQATGSAVGGKEYEYLDNSVTTGQVYYYWLIEFTRGGNRNPLGAMQQITAGVDATATPTSPAATATTQPTATSPAATATSQPTATSPASTSTPPPTATQPAQQQGQANAVATSTPVVVTDSAPAAANTPPAAANSPAAADTPAPAGTQAAGDLAATAQAAAPVATDAEAGKVDVAATEAAASVERSEGQPATLQDAGQTPPAAELQGAAGTEQPNGEAAGPTATLQAVAEAPGAAPQSQLVRPTATPRPTGSSDQGGNTSSLLLVVGGGAVCGAALLAVVVFFVWRRR